MLVLEDSPHDSEAVVHYLKHKGFSCHVAASYMEAVLLLDGIKAETLCGVVVDINLGEGPGGHQFLTYVNGKPELAHVRKIVTSNYVHGTTVSEADATLEKPVWNESPEAFFSVLLVEVTRAVSAQNPSGGKTETPDSKTAHEDRTTSRLWAKIMAGIVAIAGAIAALAKAFKSLFN